MADTGCQSCLVGFRCIQRLGINKKDLIPVTMKMHAANNQSIKILGAITLRITGKNQYGELKETRQFTYVTNDSNKFFLSRSACVDLGIISETFPTVGEAHIDALIPTDTPQNELSIPSECTCPKHSIPAPLPTELPFPAVEEN